MNFDLEEYSDLIQQPLEVVMPVVIPRSLLDEIRKLSTQRTELHKRHHDKTTDWSDNYEALGIIGELAFELLTGVPMDREDRLRGDDCDFKIRGYKIDVKTTLRSSFLRVKTYRFHEEPNFLYVFGKGNLKDLSVDFMGWIDGLTFKNKREDDEKNGHPCYKIHKTALKEMNELSETLGIKFNRNKI